MNREKDIAASRVGKAVAEEATLIYRMHVREYDGDFRDPDMAGEPWTEKYGTNLHSTSLGEQWAMRMVLDWFVDNFSTPPKALTVNTSTPGNDLAATRMEQLEKRVLKLELILSRMEPNE